MIFFIITFCIIGLSVLPTYKYYPDPNAQLRVIKRDIADAIKLMENSISSRQIELLNWNKKRGEHDTTNHTR